MTKKIYLINIDPIVRGDFFSQLKLYKKARKLKAREYRKINYRKA